jgi:hypothetical protein
MPVHRVSVGRWFLASALAGAVFLAAGCGDPNAVGKTLEVKGKVLQGGQPLNGATITFVPDEAGGNTSKFRPSGTTDADGMYTLTTGTATGTNKGAPPGKYKATVSAGMPAIVKDSPPPAMLNIDPMYGDPAKSNLSVEVVDSPPAGAYDLNLKK